MTSSVRAAVMMNLSKWQGQLDEGGLGGTHMGGIAGKAAAQFEAYFRQVLESYCSRFSIDYGAEVRSKMDGKALADLTLGELIQCARVLNQRLTRALRAHSCAFHRVLASRRLLSNDDDKLLGRLNCLRVKLSHHRQEFDEDLRGNTSRLVGLISTAMELPLFELAESHDKG